MMVKVLIHAVRGARLQDIERLRNDTAHLGALGVEVIPARPPGTLTGPARAGQLP